MTVLVIHGFTGSPATVSTVVPYLEKIGLQTVLPLLPGHGTHYEDMRGVTWQDWYNAAEQAFLQNEAVAVVGLSMGAVLAALIAARHQPKALVMLTPAFEFVNPFAKFFRLIQPFISLFPRQRSVRDQELWLKSKDLLYSRFPTSAFAELVKLRNFAKKELKNVTCPTLICHPKRDQVVKPQAAELVFSLISSQDKELRWFGGGHEMLLDTDRETVSQAVANFLGKKLNLT